MSSPGNASNSSKTSSSSKAREGTVEPPRATTMINSSATGPHGGMSFDVSRQHHPNFPPMQTMQTMQYAQQYPQGPPHHHPMTAYAPYPPTAMPDPRLHPSIPISHVSGPSNKRLAPSHPHPSETPAKKKQSKWTAEEDRSIIELRGSSMKWEDISKHLPGRSAISCRLRFQNYLERRSEWDEEKKNKLARLYERFRKEMWEKIAKEMQLPWRAAEAMHWQIGEVEMANRANVPVFHLAGQQNAGSSQAGPGSEGRSSISPSSGTGLHSSKMAYSHTHNHSLPHVPHPISHPVSPVQARLRRNSSDSSPGSHLRRRADSARSVPSSGIMGRGALPPLADVDPPAGASTRYTLPPVVTSAESVRR